MTLKLIERIPFWSNAGTAAITGLASGSAVWHTVKGTSVTTTAAAAHWLKVDVAEADALCLQYTGKIVNLGSMTAIANPNFAIPICGLHYDYNDSDLVPNYVQGAPDLYVSSGVLAQLAGSALWWANLAGGNATDVAGVTMSAANLVASGSGLFGPTDNTSTGTLAANNRVGFNLWAVAKPLKSASSTYTYTGSSLVAAEDWAYAIAPYQAVWLAVSSFGTYTGATVANMRLKGQIDVLLYKNIQDTWSVPKSTFVRRDLKSNIAATN